MSNIIPFDSPYVFIARRKAGFVDISTIETSDWLGWDNTPTNTTTTTTTTTMIQLERTETAPGRILEITISPSSSSSSSSSSSEHTNSDNDNYKDIVDSSQQTPYIVAFWLQRKLSQSSPSRDLVVRLGYKLRPSSKKENEKKSDNDNDCYDNNNDHDHDHDHANKDDQDQDTNRRWELDTDEFGRLTLVRVHILHNSIIVNEDTLEVEGDANIISNSSCNNNQDVVVNYSLNELSALQLINKHTHHQYQQQQHSSSSSLKEFTKETKVHVVGTKLIATAGENIYAVLPYYRDGTLLQFCQSIDFLDESLARFIFRQIIQGLKTLKSAGLCHRNLSLDAIAMDGNNFDIVGLGWAQRVSTGISSEDDYVDEGKDRQYLPPTPGGDPIYFSPEFYHYHYHNDNKMGTTRPDGIVVWNGFRDDLWAAGLMLYSMVVGTNALFSAPIAGDKIFTKLCIRGDIRGEVKRYGKQLGKDYSNLLSNDLLDLLRTMLRADPKQRLSLEEVMEHPWVTNNYLIITPTQWMETNRSSESIE